MRPVVLSDQVQRSGDRKQARMNIMFLNFILTGF